MPGAGVGEQPISHKSNEKVLCRLDPISVDTGDFPIGECKKRGPRPPGSIHKNKQSFLMSQRLDNPACKRPLDGVCRFFCAKLGVSSIAAKKEKVCSVDL